MSTDKKFALQFARRIVFTTRIQDDATVFRMTGFTLKQLELIKEYRGQNEHRLKTYLSHALRTNKVLCNGKVFNLNEALVMTLYALRKSASAEVIADVALYCPKLIGKVLEVTEAVLATRLDRPRMPRTSQEWLQHEQSNYERLNSNSCWAQSPSCQFLCPEASETCPRDMELAKS